MWWSVKIFSKHKFLESERELIVQIASSDGKNIILHDAFDTTEKSMELFIEATKNNLPKLFPFSWNDRKFKFKIAKLSTETEPIQKKRSVSEKPNEYKSLN